MRTVPNFNPFPRELWDAMSEEEKREYTERRAREAERDAQVRPQSSNGIFGFMAGLFLGSEFFD